MITQAAIAHWQQRVPWPTLEQVEQDLVLSRLIVEIANHPDDSAPVTDGLHKQGTRTS